MRPSRSKESVVASAVLAVVCLLFALCGCGGSSSSNAAPPSQAPQSVTEHWPAYTPDPAWQPLVADAVNTYTTVGYTYKINLQDYSTSGDYLNYGITDSFRNVPGVEQLDANGVPMNNLNGTFYYNPTVVAEFSCSKYGRWLRKFDPDLTLFWAGINKLLELQSPDGSFRYPVDFPYYLNDKFFRSGWTSGLAQGMALSALARAYLLSGDSKYLDAGNRAFLFLSKDVSAGGDTQNLRFLDPTLSAEIMADEYPAEPSAYTLNGYMYAMLGVYDWSQIIESGMAAAAGWYFHRLLTTLRQLLPYYDVGGFSAYDLGHIIYNHKPDLAPDYHEVHIYLLHALHSVTNDPILAKYEAKWAADVPK